MPVGGVFLSCKLGGAGTQSVGHEIPDTRANDKPQLVWQRICSTEVQLVQKVIDCAKKLIARKRGEGGGGIGGGGMGGGGGGSGRMGGGGGVIAPDVGNVLELLNDLDRQGVVIEN